VLALAQAVLALAQAVLELAQVVLELAQVVLELAQAMLQPFFLLNLGLQTFVEFFTYSDLILERAHQC
jgi:hypothetical protein